MCALSAPLPVAPRALHPLTLTAHQTGVALESAQYPILPLAWSATGVVLGSRPTPRGSVCSAPAAPWAWQWTCRRERPSPGRERPRCLGAALGGFSPSWAEEPPQCTELQTPGLLPRINAHSRRRCWTRWCGGGGNRNMFKHHH